MFERDGLATAARLTQLQRDKGRAGRGGEEVRARAPMRDSTGVAAEGRRSRIGGISREREHDESTKRARASRRRGRSKSACRLVTDVPLAAAERCQCVSVKASRRRVHV
jgi:hypothetical protein